MPGHPERAAMTLLYGFASYLVVAVAAAVVIGTFFFWYRALKAAYRFLFGNRVYRIRVRPDHPRKTLPGPERD